MTKLGPGTQPFLERSRACVHPAHPNKPKQGARSRQPHTQQEKPDSSRSKKRKKDSSDPPRLCHENWKSARTQHTPWNAPS
eukprot:410869-Rhodomonas_salina.1